MVRQQAFQLMQTAAIQTEILYAFIIITCSLMIYDDKKSIHYDKPLNVTAPSFTTTFSDLELNSGFYEMILRTNYGNNITEYSHTFWVKENTSRFLALQDMIALAVLIAIVFIWFMSLYGRFTDGI